MKYTAYQPPKYASESEVAAHRAERSYFDMSGDKNIFGYITTEGKRAGKRTLIQYLEKNTGVFNHNGMLSREQVKEMKERAEANKGFIWHGFISLSEHDSPKINTYINV